MMYKYLFISILFFNIIFSGCSKNVNKQTSSGSYLDEIVSFHLNEAKTNQYSLADYLELTKPYGIWDIRPKDSREVDIHGELAQGGEVSFYNFGIFSAYFKIPEVNVFQPVHGFLEQVAYKEGIFRENALTYKEPLNLLVTQIKNSDHNIFISCNKFQRVDDVFLEQEKYWKYDIQQNSPFMISTKKIFLKNMPFSGQDKKILQDLKDLRLYGAVNQNDTVVIIIDGLISYSYGYIFSQDKSKSIDAGPLFHFRKLVKVNDDPNTYFFLSN
jgi:hypothetical protein